MIEPIEIIIDLLTEFDEMGFIPTTTVPHTEAYAIKWRKEITNALVGYREQSEWISVDERLPCDMGQPEEYLVMLEHAYSPTVAMFCGGRFDKSAFCKCTVLGSKVTHWMPLPEPPKMKGGAEQ